MVKNTIILIDLAADGFPRQTFSFPLVDLIATAITDDEDPDRPPMLIV